MNKKSLVVFVLGFLLAVSPTMVLAKGLGRTDNKIVGGKHETNFFGTISAMGTDSLTVNGQVIMLNCAGINTEVHRVLTVGQSVHVNARGAGDTFCAKEINLRENDEKDDDEDVEKNETGPSGATGITGSTGTTGATGATVESLLQLILNFLQSHR